VTAILVVACIGAAACGPQEGGGTHHGGHGFARHASRGTFRSCIAQWAWACGAARARGFRARLRRRHGAPLPDAPSRTGTSANASRANATLLRRSAKLLSTRDGTGAQRTRADSFYPPLKESVGVTSVIGSVRGKLLPVSSRLFRLERIFGQPADTLSMKTLRTLRLVRDGELRHAVRLLDLEGAAREILPP